MRGFDELQEILFTVTRLEDFVLDNQSIVIGLAGHQAQGKQANATLDAVIEIFHRTHRGNYGRGRIVAVLCAQGQRVGAERARHSLQR